MSTSFAAALEADFLVGGSPLSSVEFLAGNQHEFVTLWGEGDQILWAAGEPLLICGGDGVGKTSIAQQVAIAMVKGGSVLGYPVSRVDRPVLYIAADRPKQARRSLGRMVKPEDYELLEQMLYVHTGHFSIKEITSAAGGVGAGTIFVDTLGAVVHNPGSDESGLEIYHSLQEACGVGVDVCLIHHARKRGEQWRGLDEVYGSRWITAPCGSILFLSGHAGSSEVFLRHLKQPDAAVGPGKVYHDHAQGRSFLEGRV